MQGRRLGRPRTLDRAVVERIAAARLAGHTFSGIARDLNNDAVPTARGGAQWYPSTVRSVIESESLDAEVASFSAALA